MSDARSIRDRFPGPWVVEELAAGFRVIDGEATALAYVYAPADGQRSGLPGRTLTQAEARAIAEAIAALVSPVS